MLLKKYFILFILFFISKNLNNNIPITITVTTSTHSNNENKNNEDAEVEKYNNIIALIEKNKGVESLQNTISIHKPTEADKKRTEKLIINILKSNNCEKSIDELGKLFKNDFETGKKVSIDGHSWYENLTQLEWESNKFSIETLASSFQPSPHFINEEPFFVLNKIALVKKDILSMIVELRDMLNQNISLKKERFKKYPTSFNELHPETQAAGISYSLLFHHKNNILQQISKENAKKIKENLKENNIQLQEANKNESNKSQEETFIKSINKQEESEEYIDINLWYSLLPFIKNLINFIMSENVPFFGVKGSFSKQAKSIDGLNFIHQNNEFNKMNPQSAYKLSGNYLRNTSYDSNNEENSETKIAKKNSELFSNNTELLRIALESVALLQQGECPHYINALFGNINLYGQFIYILNILERSFEATKNDDNNETITKGLDIIKKTFRDILSIPGENLESSKLDLTSFKIITEEGSIEDIFIYEKIKEIEKKKNNENFDKNKNNNIESNSQNKKNYSQSFAPNKIIPIVKNESVYIGFDFLSNQQQNPIIKKYNKQKNNFINNVIMQFYKETENSKLVYNTPDKIYISYKRNNIMSKGNILYQNFIEKTPKNNYMLNVLVLYINYNKDNLKYNDYSSDSFECDSNFLYYLNLFLTRRLKKCQEWNDKIIKEMKEIQKKYSTRISDNDNCSNEINTAINDLLNELKTENEEEKKLLEEKLEEFDTEKLKKDIEEKVNEIKKLQEELIKNINYIFDNIIDYQIDQYKQKQIQEKEKEAENINRDNQNLFDGIMPNLKKENNESLNYYNHLIYFFLFNSIGFAIRYHYKSELFSRICKICKTFII